MKMYFKDDDNQNYYYIHRHISHFPKDDAVASFGQQKQEDYRKMRARYKENYLANISGVNPEAMHKLNLAMKDDEVFRDIDEALLDTLNARVSESIAKFNLDKMLIGAYSSLNSFIKTKDLQALDGLFSQITSAAELLRSNTTELALAIGQKAWVGGGRDLNKVVQVLNEQIVAFEGKNVKVAKSQMLAVLKSTRDLAQGLSANTLRPDSLRGYLRNIFSTNIGEYIVSKGVAAGLGALTSTIQKTLTGTDSIKETEDLKKILDKFGQQGDTDFKTDNSFKNMQIHLESGDSFTINLGLSTKWYKGIADKTSNQVAITSEQNFIHRVTQLISGHEGRYYAYNALALVNQDGAAYAALKAAILARTMDYLVSGFGVQGDFSQFLVINGKFYSIWQIILALENFNNGQGTSDIHGGKTDPLTISASGLAKLATKTDEALKESPPDLHRAYARAKEQNKAIERLKLTGHFYPDRLKNALKSAS